MKKRHIGIIVTILLILTAGIIYLGFYKVKVVSETELYDPSTKTVYQFDSRQAREFYQKNKSKDGRIRLTLKSEGQGEEIGDIVGIGINGGSDGGTLTTTLKGPLKVNHFRVWVDADVTVQANSGESCFMHGQVTYHKEVYELSQKSGDDWKSLGEMIRKTAQEATLVPVCTENSDEDHGD